MSLRCKTVRSSRVAMVAELEARRLFSGYTATAGPVMPAVVTAPPVLDAAGNEFVATDAGNLYKVAPGSTTATLLASDGQNITGSTSLVVDASDDLYFIYSSDTGSESLYELPAGGSTPHDLGLLMSSAIIMPDALVGAVDASGNVYGTVNVGGPDFDGSVFEWSPATSTLSTLATFNGADGSNPTHIALDAAGDVYGITTTGGAGTTAGVPNHSTSGPGTVFEIVKGSGTVTTLATFTTSTVGQAPGGAIALDASGDVFGTDSGNGNDGILFELQRSTGTIVDLYNFTGGTTGSLTGAALTGVFRDASGDLFGISSSDDFTSAGLDGTGSVYELPTGASTVTYYYDSGTSPIPEEGLAIDASGNLFGVAWAPDNRFGHGAYTPKNLYELSPSTATTPTPTPTPMPTSTTILAATVLKSTLPTAVISGTTAKGTVSVTVTNGGTTLSKGKDTVALYATTTGAIDSASTKIGTVTKTLSLRAGASVNVAVPVKPVALPAGSYTVLAQVTDASGGSAASATGPAVAVAAANVTLTAVVGAAVPATVAPGKTFAFLLNITNAGNVKSSGKATIAVYLSTDGTSLSVPVATLAKSLTIKPGGHAAVPQLRVKLPKDAVAGTFFPVVVFTQGTATFTAAAATAVTVG